MKKISLQRKGTVVRFHSDGNTYTGFVIGTCSYDNAGPDNAYVVRYIWAKDNDGPRKPYTIVAMDQVEIVKDFPEDFCIGDGWSATPDDRCDAWRLVEQKNRLVCKPYQAGKTRQKRQAGVKKPVAMF